VWCSCLFTFVLASCGHLCDSTAFLLVCADGIFSRWHVIYYQGEAMSNPAVEVEEVATPADNVPADSVPAESVPAVTFVSGFDSEDDAIVQQTTNVSDANTGDVDATGDVNAAAAATAETVYTTREFLASLRSNSSSICSFTPDLAWYSMLCGAVPPGTVRPCHHHFYTGILHMHCIALRRYAAPCQRCHAGSSVVKEKRIELSTWNLVHILYDKTSACMDPEIKRSQVKVILLQKLSRSLLVAVMLLLPVWDCTSYDCLGFWGRIFESS